MEAIRRRAWPWAKWGRSLSHIHGSVHIAGWSSAAPARGTLGEDARGNTRFSERGLVLVLAAPIPNDGLVFRERPTISSCGRGGSPIRRLLLVNTVSRLDTNYFEVVVCAPENPPRARVPDSRAGPCCTPACGAARVLWRARPPAPPPFQLAPTTLCAPSLASCPPPDGEPVGRGGLRGAAHAR